MLAGEEDFIYRARKARKLLGGGMRQVGILAAAGIVALEKMTGRLKDDHTNAARLTQGLKTSPALKSPEWQATHRSP